MSDTAPDDRPPRLARRMYKRFLLGALIVVASSAGAVATAALLEYKDDKTLFFRDSKPLPKEVTSALDGVSAGGAQTILILGSDRRYSDIKNHLPVRSDTIILLRMDPSKGATAVMSLPRDLKVSIPGHGTDKINAAYAIGGPALTVKTVRQLLGISINHVVNVNFGGFQRAVNRLGCVYTDIDRRYFNDNHPPYGGGGNYAAIDIKAGYQKLCGEDALAFVRYRHFDTDLVRAARQQQFLADAKAQIGVGKLFSDRKALLSIFGRYTETDIRSDDAILRLLKLAFTSAQKPVQEVAFPGDITGDFVTVQPDALHEVIGRFMNAAGSSKPRGAATPDTSRASKPSSKRKKGSSATALAPGLSSVGETGQDQAVQLAVQLPFPVYYPKAIATGGELVPADTRAYDIYDRGKHRYRAYRIVVKAPGLGQYWGIQGTNWKGPPILDNPSERRTVGGRRYELFYNGQHLRLVSWRSERAVYWVANTLQQTLSNAQMLGLARAAGRIT